MNLTTTHWIGIGGAVALLGYVLWPKKASAATGPGAGPGGVPGTPPVSPGYPGYKPPVGPVGPVGPGTTPYGGGGKGMTEEQKYGIGYANGIGIGNSDAITGAPRDPVKALAKFKAGFNETAKKDGAPSWESSLGSSGDTGFGAGYTEYYDKTYTEMHGSAPYRPYTPDDTAPPTSGEDPAKAQYSLGFGNGTAAGNADAAAGKPKDAYGAMSTMDRSSWTSATEAGFGAGYNKAYDDMAASLGTVTAGTSLARVGHQYPGMHGSWYGQTFLPSYWRHPIR